MRSLLCSFIAALSLLIVAVQGAAPVGDVVVGCVLPLSGDYADQGLRAKVRETTETEAGERRQ